MMHHRSRELQYARSSSTTPTELAQHHATKSSVADAVRALRLFNYAVSFLHFASLLGSTAVAWATGVDVLVPLSADHARFDHDNTDDDGHTVVEHSDFTYNVTWLISLCCLPSLLLHGRIATGALKPTNWYYLKIVVYGSYAGRWAENIFTASVMSVLVGAAAGISNVSLISALVALTAGVHWAGGFLFETLNRRVFDTRAKQRSNNAKPSETPVIWSAFVLALFFQMVLWTVVFWHLNWLTQPRDARDVPAWRVRTVYICFFYNAVLMSLLATRYSRLVEWLAQNTNYEMTVAALSATTKILFTWSVLLGNMYASAVGPDVGLNDTAPITTPATAIAATVTVASGLNSGVEHGDNDY